MRAPLIRLSCLLSLLIATPSSSLTMEWVTVGDPGNVADTQVMNDGTSGYGAVSYAYQISKYEVTNAQYAEFLNAVAAADPSGLYNSHMRIARSGSPGSYTYDAPFGGSMPVTYVSFWDALRFANWLNHGQPTGPQDATTTEDGAYTMDFDVTRNPEATIVLTSEDEWYKAAYYDGATRTYFAYPSGSDTPTVCATPGPTSNTANCDHAVVSDPLNVGSYTGSPSPYGTFDEGGNVGEWNENAVTGGTLGGVRGGDYSSPTGYLASSRRGFDNATAELPNYGFRVVMVPEPGTGPLVVAALLALAGWRRPRT